jgi:hypothetical protein
MRRPHDRFGARVALLVKLKTANALGFTITNDVLLRADEMIQ